MNKNTGKVFDRDWFQKNQKVLVWLVNSWLGKYVFRYRKMGHYPTNKIVGISPNSITEFVKYKKGGQVELRQHFFTRNEYARKLYFVLLPMWWAMHAWDWIFANRFAPQLNFGFDTLTVYPAAGAVSPVDGCVARQPASETLATIRAGAGTTFGVTQITGGCFIGSSTTASQFNNLLRNLIFFDTSALTASATISAVVFSLYGSGKTNGLGSPDLHIALGNAAATNNLANADYAQANFGLTSFGSVTYANFSTVAYNDINLNASGIANVSKTGISKFSNQLSWDINNSFTGIWASSVSSRLTPFLADNGSNIPKLVVTYTLPAVVGAAFLFNMI